MLPKSLPARFLWTTSLLVLLSMIVLTYSGLHYFEQQFRQSISVQQSTMMAALANEIDDKLALDARLLARTARSIPPVLLANPNLARSVLAREAELLELFQGGLYLLDSEGNLLASTHARPALESRLASEPFFFRYRVFDEQVEMSQVFSLDKPEPFVLFSVAISAAGEGVAGYLLGGLNLLEDDLLQRLWQMRIGQSGYLYLYDRSRRLLIHPDPERMMQQDVPVGVNQLFDAALEGFVGTDFTVNSRGLRALSSFFPVKRADWVLAANYPTSEAYAPIRDARGYFWGVLAVAGGLSLLIAWQLVSQLTAPLKELTRQVTRLRDGAESEGPLELSQIRELRELGEVFNQFQEELKLKTRGLLEQQKFAESLVAGSALPCFVLDADHKVLLWNRACEELTGVKAEEVIGTRKHGQAFYASERPCLADQIIYRENAEEQPCMQWQESPMVAEGLQGECWVPNLNGKDRYIFFNAAPIRNPEGELVAVIENVEDLTETRRSHEATAKALSMLETMFEATADGLVVEDLEGRVLRYNRQALKMWNLEGKESLVNNPANLLEHILEQVSDSRGYQERLRQIMATPEGESFDTLEFRDGRIFERYSRPQLLHGEVVGRVWSYHDISQRRELEQRLQQIQKLEAIGQLAGGVAHDFNNLLTVINGYSSALAESPSLGSRERQIAEMVLQAGEKAADLTGQLLAFGRRQLLKPQVIDLNALIRRNEKILRHLLREDMEIGFSLASNLGLIKVDPTQLEQILINLVVNARDAMSAGGKLSILTENVTLDDGFVRANPGSVGGQYALLQVKDQGCGISGSLQERIFEPFFTTKEKGQGTGLGLATVYGIVKQSRGFISVESEVGVGSCFKIYLPLTSESPQDSVRRSAGVAEGQGRILVVEDEKSVLDLVVSALEAVGYQVWAASGPSRALELFNELKGEIDLLFTDMVMPGMTGQQLALLLKSKNPRLKVLYMSGYGEEHFDELDDQVLLLTKPFAPDALLSEVRNALISIA